MGVSELRILGTALQAEAAGTREPGDDFYCLRYHVWYPSFDCAIRTKFRTAGGCLSCEQGRFNLKRHEVSLRRYRFPVSTPCSD